MSNPGCHQNHLLTDSGPDIETWRPLTGEERDTWDDLTPEVDFALSQTDATQLGESPEAAFVGLVR